MPPALSIGAPTCFRPNEHDRFSSHAPFHFDLSILDIYVSLKHGATLVLVEEQLGKEPARLAPWIAEKKLTVWYSAPSILSLLAQFGKLEQHDYSSLRLVLFAGEVFPIKYLKLLKSLWRHPRYFNLVRSNGDQRLHVLRGAAPDSRISN